jgi:Na+-driven multidrug efflux pump
MQEPRSQLVAAAVTTVVSIPLVAILISVYGVAGAAISAVLSYLVLSTMNARFYVDVVRRLIHQSNAGAERRASAA